MPVPPLYIPNEPLQVAKNLRFVDLNGDLVTQLYPVGIPTDTPTTGYISCIGAKLSNFIDDYNQTLVTLGNYNSRISTLEVEVAAIQASGATAIPSVNAGCLSSPANQILPINVVTANLVANSCDYNTALGTPSALNSAIAAMCANLGTSAAYSQNSTMSGLAGWINTPANIAQSFANLWLAYCDARAGITQALEQSSITCADIQVNYSGVYNLGTRTITMYFYGSSIPANFSGSPSPNATFTITDTAGKTYSQTFNLYSIVGTGSLELDISDSALYENSTYTSVLSYTLTSTTPTITCTGSIPGTVINNSVTCPNMNVSAASSTSIQFTLTPSVISNVVYTVQLLATSGSTGTTILQTKTYTDPASPVTDTFTGLSSSTTYGIVVSVTTNEKTTVCPFIIQATPS